MKASIVIRNILLVLLVSLIIAISALVIAHYVFKSKIAKLAKVVSSPKEWDNRRLIDLEYRSSHNSYLSFTQHLSFSNTKAIANALALGARGIELDLGVSKNNLVVGHGNNRLFTTTTISLKEALEVIKNKAFESVDDPLFINIEFVHDLSDDHCNELVNRLNETFGDQLLRLRNNTLLAELTLKDCRNKVIVMVPMTRTKLDLLTERYNWQVVGSKDSNVNNLQKDVFYRLFPEEWYSPLSYNIDSLSFKDKSLNMIAMNFSWFDNNLYKYLLAFGRYPSRAISRK